MTETHSLGQGRSWLFVPGDSDRKLEKAAASAADIILIDLEDAVVETEKPAARERVRQFLQDRKGDNERFWVRINPIQSRFCMDDLIGIMPGRPGGVMLPKSRGRADLELLDTQLSVFEAINADVQGATGVIVVATETPVGMLSTHQYPKINRLKAMTWGAEDLATALGASTNRMTDGEYSFTYKLARTMCLVGSAVAEVSAIETMHGNFRDEAGLKALATQARQEGFGGMIAIHPAQVPIINEVFQPSTDELRVAREIVELFDQNPTLGVIAMGDEMLDRPHLVRAQAIISRAGKS